MKKNFLAGLTTGLFMVGLVGLSQAAPDSRDSKKAGITMLKEKALKALPAAGCEKVIRI